MNGWAGLTVLEMYCINLYVGQDFFFTSKTYLYPYKSKENLPIGNVFQIDLKRQNFGKYFKQAISYTCTMSKEMLTCM